MTVRLAPNVTLGVRSDGELAACFYGHSVNLGKFSIGAVSCVQTLLIGLPVSSFSSGSGNLDKEIQLLTQRLATHGLLEYRLGLSRKGDDLVVIEPQLPDYWPQTPTLWPCRGSPTCEGAATRWCSNRLALVRCSEFAIRRLRPPWPYFLHRTTSNNSVGRTVFPALSFLPCWLIAKSFSRRRPLATMASDRARVTPTSFFGIFMIFFSTRAARKAGTPTHRADFILMRDSFLLYRRSDRDGPERKSICAGFRPRQSLLQQRSCVNVIPRAASMISDRSRSRSLRGFSTAPRASSPRCEKGSSLAMAVQ